MTETPMSVAPTASERATVPRFDGTERAVHWIHAAAFFSLLATGLALYLPVLASMVGNRPVLKALHLGTATLWLTALLALAVAGDRRRLRHTRQELERFTDDDLAWLRRRPARSGRFNAGQKLHAVLQAALAALFVITGVLLWLGLLAGQVYLLARLWVRLVFFASEASLFQSRLAHAGYVANAAAPQPEPPIVEQILSVRP